MTISISALTWRGDALELIDQRLLPIKHETVLCWSAADVAAAIRDMAVRGAPAIGCAAAFGIALEAGRHATTAGEPLHQALMPAFKLLQASRPTAVNLFWALQRMRNVLEKTAGLDPASAAERLTAEAVAIRDEDLATNLAIGRAGAALLQDGCRIMTHCNAGALATAGHGTALGVMRSARDQGKAISVIVNETRPWLQGARLTAWELLQEHIPAALATDSMAGSLMKEGRIDVVIVGADRIAANGDTANKIGTYTLAVLAQHHHVPFYVAAPLSSIDMTIPGGEAIPIEHRAPEEVTGYGGIRWAPEGIVAINPAFDVTPAGLISALITEKGVLENPDAAGLGEIFRR